MIKNVRPISNQGGHKPTTFDPYQEFGLIALYEPYFIFPEFLWRNSAYKYHYHESVFG